MRKIDLDTWDRSEYFAFYTSLDFPYINIGAEVDVTNLLEFAHARGLSSYLTLIHTAHQTAHQIVNFRYRIVEGEPAVVDKMDLTYTYMPEGSELFINVVTEFWEDLLEFHAKARARAIAQGKEVGLGVLSGRRDLIGYSAVPWVQYTHFVRTIARCGQDSNPKMSWGKYFARGERVLVPFSVQVHHGLMDGYHIGLFYQQLQARIDRLV